MNKKKIIPTTIMFFAIVGVIVVFKSVFGDINTLVGVSGITAALSLLGTDYTINPIKSTFYFVLIELLLGVGSFLSSNNAFLGFVITFAVIFFILYEFTYNTKKPTYVAFTLGYFFMLYTPVTINQLPTRLLSLAFCGLFIMALQIIVNYNKSHKQSKVTIRKSIESIVTQIRLVSDDKNWEEANNLNYQVTCLLKDYSSSIHNRLDKDVKLPSSFKYELFISQFLENINIILQEIKVDNINNEYISHLNNLIPLLNDIDTFIDDDIELEFLLNSFNKYLNNKENYSSKYYTIYKLNYYVYLLKEDLLLKDEDLSKRISEEYSISSIANNFNRLKNNLNKDSLKFTFSFRGALVTSLGVFVVSLFDIPNGKWLVFSLISIVQPYLESSKIKGKDRIIGTIIGLIIFEFLFTLVTDNTLRTLIILLTGYISNFQTVYKYQMACTTISSLGSASMVSEINELVFLRISLVLLGTLIALYANKLIFPYSMKDITKDEIRKSVDLNKKIISMLYKIGLVKGKINDDLRKVITENMLINNKIEFNNNTLLSEDINEFLYYQRIFAHKLHFLINNSKIYFNEESHYLNLFYKIDKVLIKDMPTRDVINILNDTNNVYARLILINALEMKETLKTLSKISNNICNRL